MLNRLPAAIGKWLIPLLCVSLALNLLLLPIPLNPRLKAVYGQTWAHWRSKIIQPERVFLGDSMTANGGDFGHFGDINLAAPGLLTWQIVGNLRLAQAYNPRRIFVMAGSSDIMAGRDPQTLAPAWREILSDPRVVVTLLPPMRTPSRKPQVDALNAMIERMAREAGRPVIVIPGLANPDGSLKTLYSVDDVHLNGAAYAIWRREIGRVG